MEPPDWPPNPHDTLGGVGVDRESNALCLTCLYVCMYVCMYVCIYILCVRVCLTYVYQERLGHLSVNVRLSEDEAQLLGKVGQGPV